MKPKEDIKELKDGQAIPLADRNGVEPPAIEQEYREAASQLRNFLKGVCGKALRNSDIIRYRRELDRLGGECDKTMARMLDQGYLPSVILGIWKEGQIIEGIRST